MPRRDQSAQSVWRRLFEKHQVELTGLELFQIRATQLLSAVIYIALRVALCALALVGVWLFVTASL